MRGGRGGVEPPTFRFQARTDVLVKPLIITRVRCGVRLAAGPEVAGQPYDITVRGQLRRGFGDLPIPPVDSVEVATCGGHRGVAESLHEVGKCGAGLSGEGLPGVPSRLTKNRSDPAN